MSTLKMLTRREKIVGGVKSLRNLRFKTSHSFLIQVTLLSLIISLAFIVRLLPLRWGFHLSEFDPYFHYRSAEYLVENGFVAWNSWTDYMRWYPFGQQVVAGSYPGLPVTAVFFYTILNALGLPITLFELCVIFPAIMGALTCLVIYFLCKDIGGREAAIFSSLFLALNSAYIGRTALGFFDDETVGIFSILLFFFFFLRSIEKERSLRSNLFYAVASGLSLGYLCTSWGAARYPIAMAALLVFILILLRRYSSRLLFSYSVSFGIAFLIAINVPKLGFNFLTETYNLPVAGVFLLLCLCELVSRARSLRAKTILTVAFLCFSVVTVFVLVNYGVISATPGKFINVINPFARADKPLVESVAEHKPAAWGTFYYEYGIIAFLIPVGLFFTVQNPTNRNIFISIFALTTVYFASSMVRLTLLMAPAFCILGAVALVRLIRPFVTIMKESPSVSTRRKRFRTYVGKEFSAAFLIVMFILLLFSFVFPNPRSINTAYSPTTIASSSIPIKGSFNDWIEALTWMRDNLPQNAIVASWWDYGYWITAMGNKTTLVDNGTINSTQIGNVGWMFMSNETTALVILGKYDATHVVVFTTIPLALQSGQLILYGEEVKWTWMAKIAASNVAPFINETELMDTSITSQLGLYDPQRGRNLYLPKSDRVLTKLIVYPIEELVGFPGLLEEDPVHFNLVFASSSYMVFVYEIDY